METRTTRSGTRNPHKIKDRMQTEICDDDNPGNKDNNVNNNNVLQKGVSPGTSKAVKMKKQSTKKSEITEKNCFW